MFITRISIRALSFLLVGAACLCGVAFAGSGNNAVPYVDASLVPASIKPGGSGFTLTVNGAGFVSSSVVNWNGSTRVTTFVSNTQLIASILAADIASKGTASITVSSPPPGGGSSNVVFFPILNTVRIITGAEQVVSDAVSSQVVADFNHDGKLDLVGVASGYDVEVFLGKGDGSFQTPISVSGGCNGSLIAADFNGDGNTDLAQLCGNGLQIFLGNGDGTFQSPMPTGSFGAVFAVAAGDFNHDGNIDLAVADTDSLSTYAGEVSILLGNGNGTFQSPTHFALGTFAQLGMFIIVSDFNNDGSLDLAVASQSSNAVSILLGNGDGTFQVMAAVSVGFSPNTLAAADFNVDGRMDLVMASRDPDVFVLLGNGDGTFASPVGYRVPAPSLGGLSIGDFNGDGIIDVAVSTYSSSSTTISVLLGKGDGTFKPASNLGNALLETNTLNVGDFNGDGWLDFVVGSAFGATNVYLQAPFAASVQPGSLKFAAQKVGTSSSPQQVWLSNTGEMTLRISGIRTKGEFTQTNNCGLSVPVRGTCTVYVTFTPTETGTRKGQLTFGDSATNSPQLVALTGTGTN
jgi:hypothetical protein